MFLRRYMNSSDWEYEREWRLTYFTEAQLEGKNNLQVVPTPVAIYLGPRFDRNPEKYKARLQAIAAGKGIPLKSMQIHPTEYRVIEA